jgi:hypothetical protein
VPEFGTILCGLNYINIAKIPVSEVGTIMELVTREKCDLLAVALTVPI